MNRTKTRTPARGVYAWSRQAGFSIIEMLMTVSLIGFLGTMTLQSFHNWLPRMELRDSVQKTRALISRARLEAIQRGVTTAVQIDVTDGSIIAFADVNGSSVAGSEGYPNYLKFDPDPTKGNKQTDYEIGRIKLENSALGGAGFDPVSGFSEVPGAPEGSYKILVFSVDGKPLRTGSFRIADSHGSNIIEVAVASLAGKVETRKFLSGFDSPTSAPGFFPDGQRADGTNVWVWY